MSRWTGDPEVTAVLEGSDAWRERCFLADSSIFTDRALWTLANLETLLGLFAGNPIVGSSRDFLDKLSEQLKDASRPVIQVAAEAIWFLLLFPSPNSMKAETKREAVRQIWSWSKEELPNSPYLNDAHLHGVGHPGTAYLTQRPAEFEYLLKVVIAFKRLAPAEQRRLMQDDVPWTFMDWLDQQDGSDRRLVRHALLYFLFPDQMERNTSREHRHQIYEALKGKLLADQRIRSRNRTQADYDRAIVRIRAALEQERGKKELDFYQDDIKRQWFAPYREGKRKDFTSWLDTFLIDRGLKLNTSGRDTSLAKIREKEGISPETGFWSQESGYTAKPPRWLVHFDFSGAQPIASIPGVNGARAIGFRRSSLTDTTRQYLADAPKSVSIVLRSAMLFSSV
ncbi:MAG: hypothetical protein J0H17_21935 [Rhizobiales bacterium]|nr:hypothetical protein [Hyphomicrobiales bacterium]